MPFFLSVSLVSSASKINSKVGQDLPAGKDNTPLSLGQVWVCFFKLFACFVCTYAQTQIWEQSLYNWPTILGSHKKTWDGHPGAYYHIFIFEGICFLLYYHLFKSSKPQGFPGVSNQHWNSVVEWDLFNFFSRCEKIYLPSLPFSSLFQKSLFCPGEIFWS